MTRYLLLTILLWNGSLARAEVRLPKVLGSHMVLQRDSRVPLWGWATPGEELQIRGDWLSAAVSTTADENGSWRVLLQTGGAGGPHRLTILATNRIELRDVLFGEVWLASGQSNMEMPLIKVSGAYTGIKDATTEVANASHPQIRLFQVGNFSSKIPLEDVETGISMYGIPPSACRWQACAPETIPTFASTAYFFARTLQTTLQVPIGIIDASWGGTSAEAWTPVSGLRRLEEHKALQAAAERPQQANQKIPSRLYNGMIHPLRNVHIKGVIWYQGESNVGRANQYRRLFSTLITSWRSVFGYDFPFYFVQLAPYDYGKQNSAYLREAQLQTLAIPQTGMAVTMDIGNLRDIHPKNKQEVGRRLALWALARDYSQDVIYSGPLYRAQRREASRLRLMFDHASGGLATRDGQPPTHLEIAGRDLVFHPATAAIEGEELIVSSPHVPQPQVVRYGFTSTATPNLMNQAGLPASSFRTDGSNK
ncbi:MAG: sialate O-acetylesterase [Planctomycetota bacterium]|nr:sialate O-acetylesterase [Planctomycetota bacterium]